MTEQTPPRKKPLSPKLQKVRNNLDRVLSDYDLSQQEYNSLIDDLKKRRRRIDGAGDSVFDDITEE
ncbi:hypothetical protein EHM69_11895 [candidate division KSB1 bacterium]|nr:MAG: hypothetical protein EHM69_11895 [candidate division KSB1 bacterium]